MPAAVVDPGARSDVSEPFMALAFVCGWWGWRLGGFRGPWDGVVRAAGMEVGLREVGGGIAEEPRVVGGKEAGVALCDTLVRLQ